MTTWNPRANELFLKALELRSVGERQEYLDGACAGDAAMRAEVEALLEASAHAGDFLESPASALHLVAACEPPVAERPGTVIGPYKLLEQIGEGGFGVVFMAEQTQPVRRKVALKVLKPGMDTRQVVARFEAERQALALMDHPNIAKVFDGGATPSGRPYFVMELVKGVPITDFCDQNHLTPRQRLELFVPVCQAVQHAHHKGIIHRDLKPSNILVTMHDTTPVVKVIDFGVVKALGQELTDKTLFTGFAQMIGTPLYMSPEQAGQSSLDIDTRSDIYSLGVLLYELLTGTTPFTKERFKEAAYEEIRRIIREEDPPRPSTRLSESKESLPSISAQRQTEPAKLTKLVRGELDWIVMKALEKDRSRRYETANSFALDVQRYLSGELVQACPPSAGYRLRKFVSRRRGPVLAAGAVFVMLIVGLAIALVSNWQVNQALDDRNRALGRLEEEQEKTAQALVRETGLKNQATEALEQERLALYSYRVSLAQREWYANRVGRAEFLLDECPAPLRAWEWHYLKRLCHADLMTIRGHKSMAYAAAFSPDGKQVASCGGEGIVRIWDAATGQEVRSLKAHAGIVLWVAFSPDGRRLASAGADRTIRLWDVATGQEGRTIRGHDKEVLRVVFSPDGRQIASTDGAALLKIWDANTAQEVRTIRSQRGTIRWVTYSRDGTSLAWDEGAQVVVAAAATGQERRRWQPGKGKPISALALSPDSRQLATGGRGVPLVLWDVTSGKEQLTLARSLDVKHIEFSADGKRVATAHDDQTVRVWDAATGAEQLVLRGHTGMVSSVAFDPDGRRLVSTSADATVKVWNATAHQDVNPGSHRRMNQLRCMAVSPDGQCLALGSGMGTSRVLLCDATHGAEMDTRVPGSQNIMSVAFSPDGRRLAAGNVHGRVRIWDVEHQQEVVACAGHQGPVLDLAFSPEGKWLASAGADRKAIFWDAATGQEVRTLAHSGSVEALSFSPDGQRLATCDRGTRLGQDAVRVWDMEGRELFCQRGHDRPVSCVAFNPDGKQVATGGADRQVKLWDAATGAELRTLGGHGSGVMSVAFHPNGRRLAAGTLDGAIVIWDLTTGREALTLRGESAIKRLAFLPDGTSLVAACADGFVRFWNGTPLEERPKEELK